MIIVLEALNGKLRSAPEEWPDPVPPIIRVRTMPRFGRYDRDCLSFEPTAVCTQLAFEFKGQYAPLSIGSHQTHAKVYELVNEKDLS